MASYVDDSGSHGYDALVTDGCSVNTTTQVATLDASGLETGFTLPVTSAWLLVETYDVEGVAGAIGMTWWQFDVATVKTHIDAFRSLADGKYTNYKMRATEYSGTAGTNAVDVWECDQTAGFGASADYTEDFTPSGTEWVVSDTLVGPDENIGTTSELVHVNIGHVSHETGYTPPDTVNHVSKDALTSYTLDDKDGVDSGWSVEMTSAFVGSTEKTTYLGDNTGFHFDCMQRWNAGMSGATPQLVFTVDTGGTYEITVTGTSTTGSTRVLGVKVNSGTEQTILTEQTEAHYSTGLTFSGISDSSGEITVDFRNADSGLAYASSLTIQRTA